MHPYFNWGDPETPKRFMDHVMGWQYQSWMKLDLKVFDQQTSYFLNHLPQQVAYLGLGLAVLGIIQLARRSAKLSVFVALLLIACIGYAGSFEIMEIMPYYMVAIFAIGIWCVAGLAWLYERLGSRPALLIGLVMALATCAVNFHDSDESKNVLVEDMTLNMLRTLPPNALVLSSQWDFWLAGSWYKQVVEKMRPDVLVVDPELWRRSWYLDELEHNHPEFMAKVRPEVERFRPQLYKFEHGLDYVSAEIDGAYTGMIDAMINKNIDSRPVHITGEIDPGMSARYQRVPYYLTMRLMRDSAYIPMEFPKYQFHFWEGRVDPYAAKLYELYARSVQARMIYEGQHGDDALAKRYAAYLLSFDPHYSIDDVPDAPLNGEDQITGAINYFNEMRSKLTPLLNQK
jgi:hypothetical protein